jgi:hypothetical protein
MSAYDKDFSDAIYGIEQDGRYVTESLKRMITMEGQLIEERLSRKTMFLVAYYSLQLISLHKQVTDG